MPASGRSGVGGVFQKWMELQKSVRVLDDQVSFDVAAFGCLSEGTLSFYSGLAFSWQLEHCILGLGFGPFILAEVGFALI